MKAIAFENQTHCLNKGTDNEIPFHFGPVSKFVTVCVEVSEAEMQELKDNGNRLFVTVVASPGMPFPLVDIKPQMQFRELTDEEKKQVEDDRKRLHVVQNRKKRNNPNGKPKTKTKIITMK